MEPPLTRFRAPVAGQGCIHHWMDVMRRKSPVAQGKAMGATRR
ncbi:hypothetical protein [Algimonas arctica]|nr:hypothetical protein [Algimonas arctica]